MTKPVYFANPVPVSFTRELRRCNRRWIAVIESKIPYERVTITNQAFHRLTYKDMKLIIELLDEDVKTQLEYNSNQMQEDEIKLTDDQVALEVL